MTPNPPGSRWPFRLLWSGQTVNGVGGVVSTIAVPLVAVQHLHASTFDVGVLEAVEWIPAVLLGLPIGAFVDRHHPRALMMAANIGQAAAMGAVPFTAAFGVLSLPVLLGAAVTAGFFGVFFQTAYSPYVRELVDPGDLVAANARIQAGRSAAMVSGPSIGGALVAAIGAADAVIADAASFIVSFLALWAIGPSTSKRSPSDRRPVLGQISEGVRYLRTSPLLVTLAVAGAGANLFLTAMGAVEIVFLVRVVGVPAGVIGLLFTIGGAGGLTGAVLATRLITRLDTFTVARGALALTSPFALLIPLAHHGPAVALFAVGGFAVSFGIALANVSFLSLTQLHCPSELLGRVTGSSRLLSSASIPVGALLGGGLGELTGTRSALVVMAAGYLIFGLGILRSPLRALPSTAGHLSDANETGRGQTSTR